MAFPYNYKLFFRLLQLKILSICEILFSKRVPEKPTIHCQNNAMNKFIQIAIQHTGLFYPSFWAPGPYSQMLLGSIIKRKKYPYTRREVVSLSDGVQVYLDWKESDIVKDNTPIVVICHGISGDSDSCYPCKASDALYDRGLRPVIFNRRGHKQAPISQGQFYPIHTDTRDMHDVATYLQNRYPLAPLIVIGTSAGGNLLLRYIGEYSGQHPFKAAYASSSAYNIGALCRHYKKNPFASSMLTLCMLTMLDERKSCTEKLITKLKLDNQINVSKLFKHSKIWKLDEELVMPFFPGKFKDVEDFYDQNSCYRELANIDVPTLLLNSRDDVLIAPELIKYAVDAANQNKNIVSTITHQGSHCGWIMGNDFDSWDVKLMCNYVESILYRS